MTESIWKVIDVYEARLIECESLARPGYQQALKPKTEVTHGYWTFSWWQ
jgi:hypothetical protein